MPLLASAESPLVVLHVEDDERLGASMAVLLRAEGHQPVTARDGASALARITEGKWVPDVLIMDFNLPGEMDGADVAQEICRLLGHVVPTIFLSGVLSDAAMPWLPGAPLFFVSKPVDPEILLKVVAGFGSIGRFIGSRRRH